MCADMLAETKTFCVVMVFMHAQMFSPVVKLCVLASGCTWVFTGSGDSELLQSMKTASSKQSLDC